MSTMPDFATMHASTEPRRDSQMDEDASQQILMVRNATKIGIPMSITFKT